MSKAEVVAHLEAKGVRVLAIRNEDGVPKATIAWGDYPKLLFPCQDALLNSAFGIALR